MWKDDVSREPLRESSSDQAAEPMGASERGQNGTQNRRSLGMLRRSSGDQRPVTGQTGSGARP